jgi:uncharacterized protein GlcG (DUF336 family)
MNRSSALTIAVLLTGLAARSASADVPLAKAIAAAESAIAACKAQSYHVTVVVLDSNLATRVVLRSDDAPDDTIEIARRKAYTVIKAGMSSGDFGKTVGAPLRVADSPTAGPKGLSGGTVSGDPNLTTWAGGLPIKLRNKIIGSISVSGAADGAMDEACAKAGLAKIFGAPR